MPDPWPSARAAIDGAAGLAVTPWPDASLDADGHDPRSPYAERFWLPIVGPTTLLLHRHLLGGLDRRPEGYALDPLEVSCALGLGPAESRGAPLGRALLRLVRFHQAEIDPAALRVRLHLPTLSPRQAERLPRALAAEHVRVATALIEVRRRAAVAARRIPAA